MKRWRRWLALCLLAAGPAEAHVASNGFLALEASGASVHGQLELAVRDAELAVGLDANHDGRVDWGEARNAQASLAAYVGQHLRFASGTAACKLDIGALQASERVDGIYLWLPLEAHCPALLSRLSVSYSVLDEEDPSHRGLLTLTAAGGVQSAVLGGSANARAFDIAHPSAWPALGEYFVAGVGHIWSGIDHLLFLLSLLLPAVLVRTAARWQPVDRPMPAFIGVLKVVTAFTLAHSVTLTLAALDLIRLPGRLTESVIAASIIVAALNNVVPIVTQSRWRIAFAFGLLHGFGFASVLAEMGLPPGARLASLVGFNLGVEAGQLAVVLAVMPLAWWLRRSWAYRRAIMPWGSAAIAALALVWLVQRAAG